MQFVLENAPAHWHVRYRVHIKDEGWLGWMQDGVTAGDDWQHERHRIEALEMVIVCDNPGLPNLPLPAAPSAPEPKAAKRKK